jgi:hypothetical protein
MANPTKQERVEMLRKILKNDPGLRYYALEMVSDEDYNTLVRQHHETKKYNWTASTYIFGGLSFIMLSGMTATAFAGLPALGIFGFAIYSAHRMKRAHEEADKAKYAR